jgi:hypothetical protein
MGWLFGKKPRAEWRDKPQAITSTIPRDDDRAGPVPPPPRTAHAPGVAVYSFAEIPEQHLLRLDGGFGGFFLEGRDGGGGRTSSSALLVLGSFGTPAAAAGEAAASPSPSPGDVLIWANAPRTALADPAAPSPSYPFEEIFRTSPRPHHHIRRDDLSGRGVPGITGLRLRHAAGGLTVLRFGPPPGARWVFVGLSAIAVFAGKFTLVDGDEPKVVPAGRVALVGDPTATLYVEAGNDSALGVALGGAHVVSALG